MSCPTIMTGGRFLATMLDHVDCQAQAIGTFGYGALSAPGSVAHGLLGGLLTLFIALYGLRLMFGQTDGAADLVGGILKVGIVLTLAFSWPAWRIVGYDLVLSGPAQLAGAVGGAASLPGTRAELNERLQHVDDGIVTLTVFGTGRQTYATSNSAALGDMPRAVAMEDQTGFAWGRVAFLAGTLGPLVTVRLAAGILLALAPVMAGLLLFAGTRDLFVGWLRALAWCAFGALFLTLCYAVEIAILDGWLQDALAQRQANWLAPSAPTELLVIGLSFLLIAFAILGLLGKMIFFSGASVDWSRRVAMRQAAPPPAPHVVGATDRRTYDAEAGPARALRIADAVAHSMRLETASARRIGTGGPAGQGKANPATAPDARRADPVDALGSSYRRTTRRHSASAGRRDTNS